MMDKIREYLKNPLIAGLAGLVVGLFVGLVILGWWLWPVKWENAAVANMRPDLQQDYLQMAIQTFTRDRDILAAQQRWKELGPSAQQVMDTVVSENKLPRPEVDAFAAAMSLTVAPASTPLATVVGQPTAAPGKATAAPTQPAASAPGSNLLLLLGVLCLLLLVIGGALAYILFGRKGVRRGAEPPTVASQAQELTRQAERTNFATQGVEAPVAQFMTTYMAGDDLYDDSFSIDSPSGEFLGECGVGISETIGVGDPKKTTAFEVWLFDKNDIQTVTKVLMSAHAFNDTSIRSRLESKGDAVLSEPSKRILLETQTLQLEARVVDMSYGQGPLPPESFFDRLTLELAVWPKKAAA